MQEIRDTNRKIYIYIFTKELFIIGAIFVLIINMRLDLINMIHYKRRVRRTPG
jgi:hypothetical protein